MNIEYFGYNMIPVINVVNLLQQTDEEIAGEMERTFQNITFQANKNIHSVNLLTTIQGSLIRSIPLNSNLGATKSKFTLDNCTIVDNMFIGGIGN